MEKTFSVSIKDVITKSKMMRMDFRKGTLVEIGDVTLEIGQRVYGFLGYGGSESGTFYCISQPDDRGNQKLVEEGYRHRYMDWTVGHHDQPLSKKFGIGLYWDDVNEQDYRKPQEELDELCRQADERIRLEKEKEDRKKKDQERERMMLLKKYDGILTELSNKYDRNAIKKNLVAYIKHNYPSLKFSVSKTYGTYKVKWVGGVSEEEMIKTCSIFVDHTFNGYEDYNEYTPSEFTKLYGGLDYNIDIDRKEA